MKSRQRALLLFVTVIALSFSPAWLACAADGTAPASPPAQAAAGGQTTSHAAVTTELGGAQEKLGALLPYWSVTPFILILLAMAIVPLVHGHWWEANLNKGVVSFLCSLPILAYLISLGPLGQEVLIDILRDYYAFIVLLVALFTISGGIYLDGDLKATPFVNTAFLGIGALLASFIGTTGASILLIRPLIKTNQHRHHKIHIFIFFIFLTANIGGALLPVGDPPLFLGYLYGVPFFWTFFSMWPMWLTTVAILLGVFYFWDTWAYSKEPTAVQKEAALPRKLRLHGWTNLLLIFGVLLSVIFLKAYQLPDGSHLDLAWMQQPAMILLAVLSFAMDYKAKQRTPQGGHPAHMTPRDRNTFSFGPMIEVAVLFIGIFITMTPAICLLKAHGLETGVTEPWQFYWMSGGLSSFLDNAPTYATYFALGQGVTKGLLVSHPDLPVVMTTTGPIAWKILLAISLGSVFMGANTYIGNAPNFMVKSICEEAKIKMPSFFGYLLYSIGILTPTFLVVMFIYLI
ncbi:MAG TPA: sodium:proton antiporter [Candidatus Methylomirabilis sp.]